MLDKFLGTLFLGSLSAKGLMLRLLSLFLFRLSVFFLHFVIACQVAWYELGVFSIRRLFIIFALLGRRVQNLVKIESGHGDHALSRTFGRWGDSYIYFWLLVAFDDFHSVDRWACFLDALALFWEWDWIHRGSWKVSGELTISFLYFFFWSLSSIIKSSHMSRFILDMGWYFWDWREFGWLPSLTALELEILFLFGGKVFEKSCS